MRILFCDDEPTFTAQLYAYVSEFFRSRGGIQPEYGLYTDAQALLLQEQYADIAFLDVEMPEISGIQLGAKLKAHNPKIKIFIVTAFPDYLDEAMRFEVFRYLSKPVDQDRLNRNLQDALYRYNMETTRYTIETSAGIFVKDAEDIVCIESKQHKTLLHTTKDLLISTASVDYWRHQLTLPCYYSPHRSFIINMRYVSYIGKDTITLTFLDQSLQAFLARRKYSDFKSTYLTYLESVK